MMVRRLLRFYKTKDLKEMLETLDFPDNLAVEGGQTAEMIVFVVNPEPDDYEITKMYHTDPNVKVTLEAGSKILKPQTPYMLRLTWTPPEGNEKPLIGKLVIEGRFIIRY